MSSIFLFNTDIEANQKINIDELYEKNMKENLKQLSIFNKILGRIHKRINLTSRNTRSNKFIWFVIPEFIFGEPVYDQSECIAYIVNNLVENGFYVKYIHPNTLFVSWEQWIPSYVRSEIKKKTGKIIDEKGCILNPNEVLNKTDNINSKLMNLKGENDKPEKPDKKFTPIDNYKPSGNLIYTTDIFNKLQEKL
jgi:hypothetical protein